MVWLVITSLLVICFGFVVLRGAPYVPTHRAQLQRALSTLYPLSKRDTLLDLGSGDGIVLRMARRYGASAVGYELNPVLVLISRLLSGRDRHVRVTMCDYTMVERLPHDVTVVYVFATSHSISSVARKMEEWSRGRELHLISYGFTVPGKRSVRHVGPMHLYKYVDGV